MTLFSELHDKVRTLLKAAQDSKDTKKPQVPDDPGDPDELQPDYRVGKASPNEKDVQDAKEADEEDPEQVNDDQDGAVAKPEDTDEEETEDDESAPDEDDEEDDEEDKEPRPMQKGFDDFGNRDLTPAETRALLKSLDYGVTPPMAQDKLLSGGEDVKAMLDDILALLTHQQGKLESYSAVMSDLLSEIDRLKKGSEVHDREIAKALNLFGNPTTAPAEAPRGIAKSYVPPTVVPAVLNGADLANEIFAGMKSGHLSAAKATAMCREARLGAL